MLLMETRADLTYPQLRGIAVALGRQHAVAQNPEDFHEAVIALLDACGASEPQREVFGATYEASEQSQFALALDAPAKG